MPPIKLQTFGGIQPLLDARLLPESGAQVAHNCVLERGTIVPYRAPLALQTVPAGTRSVYLYRDAWLTWTGDVRAVAGPLADDQFQRLYFTGDGVPKVRGLVNGVERTFPLGIPKPAAAPAVTVRTRTTEGWTRSWHYFFEEPDGTQKDAGDLTEGTDVTVVTAGTEYRVASPPARSTASDRAKFVLYADGYRVGGSSLLLGRVYPQVSNYRGNSDLYVDGAKVSARQTTRDGVVTFKLDYDTSESSRYTVDRSWVFTYVSAWGEEGPPSDPTDVTTVNPNQEVMLSGMGSTSPSGYNIAKKRIYRTVTGDAGTDFQFIAEIDVSAASFVDTVADQDAAEALPSDLWYAPPEDLTGLVALAGEFLAGYSGKTVWFSEVAQPHAWPSAYSLTVDHPIRGLAVSGSTLAVLTTREPFIIDATDPQNTSMAKVPNPQGCVSARSAVEFGGAVFYASADGLVQLSGLTAVVVTASYFQKEQWLALKPETMQAVVFDDRLYLFAEATTLVLWFASDGIQIVTVEDLATAAWRDADNDRLVYVAGTTLNEFSPESGAARTVRWRGREYAAQRPVDFGVARVVADTYPVTLRLFANGVEKVSRQMTHDRAVRLPQTRPEKFWTIEVEGPSAIREVLVGRSMTEL